MGDDDLYQTVGRIEGKLDSLSQGLQGYTSRHEDRHRAIDDTIDTIKTDINQAKGAKNMAVIAAGAVATAVAAVWHGVEKFLK